MQDSQASVAAVNADGDEAAYWTESGLLPASMLTLSSLYARQQAGISVSQEF
jgi:hypothetical protein